MCRAAVGMAQWCFVVSDFLEGIGKAFGVARQQGARSIGEKLSLAGNGKTNNSSNKGSKYRNRKPQ